MSIKYRTIERTVTDMKGGPEETKIYAIPVYNGHTTLDDVCQLIAMRSSMSSADVKSILDSLNVSISFFLASGRIVQLGELGSFRTTILSSGADTYDAFNVADNIKKSRIVFVAGKSLKKVAKEMKYIETKRQVVTLPCDKPHIE